MTDGLDDATETVAEHVAASAADPSEPGAKARKSRKAALQPDAEPGHCANCGTKLQGPVCHHCGQLDDEFHRPVRGLIGEIIEGFFALDGRVARTIPNLLLRPGRVTREYLQGKRARFMPPFRLYIIASLTFFLLLPFLTNSFELGEPNLALSEAAEFEQRLNEALDEGTLTPEQAEEARAVFDQFGLGAVFPDLEERLQNEAGQAEPEATTGADPPADPTEEVPASEDVAPTEEIDPADAAGSPLQLSLQRGDGTEGVFELREDDATTTAREIREYLVPEEFGQAPAEDTAPLSVRTFLADRAVRIAEDPGAIFEEALEWVPRIMFALVPVYALLLSLTYAWRRGFYFYDHLIVSVHFHSALFLTMTILYLASYVLPGALLFLVWVFYSHFYLYKIHRVVYERHRALAVLRTLALSFVYGIVLTVALAITLLLGALSV